MIQSVHAILLLNDHYLLQLRDMSPHIAASGEWSLFGGRVHEGEKPADAIEREIEEELSLRPSFEFLWSHNHFGEFEQRVIRVFFFSAHVNTIWSTHRLKEGRAVQAFPFEDLKSLQIPSVMRSSLDRFHGHFFQNSG